MNTKTNKEQINIENIDKKLTFIINENSNEWYKYYIIFPHDDDDYYYDLYYEDQNGIFEKKDYYLVLKIDNNRKFVKEVYQDEYDLYNWSNNEHPLYYYKPYYKE